MRAVEEGSATEGRPRFFRFGAVLLIFLHVLAALLGQLTGGSSPVLPVLPGGALSRSAQQYVDCSVNASPYFCPAISIH